MRHPHSPSFARRQNKGQPVCQRRLGLPTDWGSRESSSARIDAVGQGEAHRLLEPGFARDLLDRFAGEETLALRDVLRAQYDERRTLREERDALSAGGDRALAEREFARFAHAEIAAAALEAGEDERLRVRHPIFDSSPAGSPSSLSIHGRHVVA